MTLMEMLVRPPIQLIKRLARPGITRYSFLGGGVWPH